MLDHYTIECSYDQHDAACLLPFVVFPARARHANAPPKLGGRVSLRMQFERNEKCCFRASPKEAIFSISQDRNDPLFELV